MSVVLSFVACISMTIGLHVPVNKNMRSFTSALKTAYLQPNQESVVYENTEGPGVISELWFTGSLDENTTLRIYVDDDYVSNKAAIECFLYKCHNIGYTQQIEGQYTPWSTKRVGHLAYYGGLYNTYPIPFSKQVKVTLEQPTATAAGFYFIVGGVYNYPVFLGNVQLPSNARLRLFKNENVIYNPLDMVTLANITNSSGAVFLVFMAASTGMHGGGYPFIEGCYRVKIDDDTINGHQYQFLSSGVEDFYLSGYAFDKGVYHGDNTGCTYILGGAGNTNNITMSAYKFFENYPLLFSNSISLMWKVGSNSDCPNTWPPNKGDIEEFNQPNNKNYKADQTTTVTTYTWIYTYDL